MTPKQIYFINLARKKKNANTGNRVRPGTSSSLRYIADKLALL